MFVRLIAVEIRVDEAMQLELDGLTGWRELLCITMLASRGAGDYASANRGQGLGSRGTRWIVPPGSGPESGMINRGKRRLPLNSMFSNRAAVGMSLCRNIFCVSKVFEPMSG